MNKQSITKPMLFAFALMLVLLMGGKALADASFSIITSDYPDEGFNDPTPVAPVGGNTGTTLGEQRLIAFEHAAKLWGAKLDSGVMILMYASFDPLSPNVLGQTSPTFIVRDFPRAEFPGTWYVTTLANKRAGYRTVPAVDAIAQFSSNANFYLGLDNNHGSQVDLVTVLLHEFAHALGFLPVVDLTNGRYVDATDDNPDGGHPDIFSRHLLDSTNGLHWHQMTAAERLASAGKFGQLVWDGAEVTAGVPNVLSFGSPQVKISAPAAIAGSYQFGTAYFGPLVGNPNITKSVVAAVDAVEPATSTTPTGTTTDGCSPFTNAVAVAGNIALVERGLCSFAVKARNATNAGAAGVIIYNNAINVNASPPGMADDGINGAFVTIPTVSLRHADGLAILGQLMSGSVTASLEADPSIRAGADQFNRARLFSPSPISPGSSAAHFDRVASRNLLMEPAINDDLTHNLEAPDDLTLELMRDIGWFTDADLDAFPDDSDCEPNSDMRDTVVIGGIDSGAPNYIFNGGCTTADQMMRLAATSSTHGQFVSRVAEYLKQLPAFVYPSWQKGAIQSAAARSNLP
jgi:hypothetical protein